MPAFCDRSYQRLWLQTGTFRRRLEQLRGQLSLVLLTTCLLSLVALPTLLLAQPDPTPRHFALRADVGTAPDDLDPDTPAAGDLPAIGFTESIDVSWILIPATVWKKEALDPELSIADFELFIDEQPVAIETFENRADAPVSIVYLQDLSGSMSNFGKVGHSQAVTKQLIEQLLGGDELALVTFAGDRVTIETPFTNNRQTLFESTSLWEAYGTTALYDAITWLPEISLDSTRTRRAAVVVTDGLDNASEMPIEETRQHVVATQLPVYVIDLSHFGRHTPSTAPATNDKVAQATPLRDLAEGTGGRLYRPTTLEQLNQATAELAREVRSQYVLGFAADGSENARPHQVEVRVSGRKRTVRHRPMYHGPSPAAFSTVHH